MKPQRFASAPFAFTLIELLVVIGIIALLISILMPVLTSVREKSQRVVCATRMRQLAQVVHMYSNENKGRIPAGSRDPWGGQPSGEHLIWVSSPWYDAMCFYLGTKRTTAGYLTLANSGRDAESQIERFLACPNVSDEQAANRLPAFPGTVGWLIGYNYLGDHLVYPNCWRSPHRINESGSLPLFCDFNDHSPGDGWTMVSHRRRSAGGYFYPPGGAKHPRQWDSAGGNVGYLDGSVVWKNLDDMIEYETVPPFGYGSNVFANYRGMW